MNVGSKDVRADLQQDTAAEFEVAAAAGLFQGRKPRDNAIAVQSLQTLKSQQHWITAFEPTEPSTRTEGAVVTPSQLKLLLIRHATPNRASA